jgi:hypothetical protein
MAIDGVQAFAKCTMCGTVIWTEVHPNPNEKDQACICRCGNTGIANTHVIGDADQNFSPATFEELVAAEASS